MELIDRSYLLIERIGEGGMGAVYRATERLSGRTVALKLLGLRGQPVNADERARVQLRLALAREFQTLASLHHPNVIRVLSYGFDDVHGPYFTMELLAHARDIVQAAAEQPLFGKIQLLAQLLRAAAYLHRRGILHRDLKPSNVLCIAGEVKVLDFGIAARINGPDDVAGTLEYLAPEILLGAAPTAASDLYSIGVITYQLLTGQLPYSRTSMSDFLNEVLGTQSHMTISGEVSELLARYRAARQHAEQNTLLKGEERWLTTVSPPLRAVVERLLARYPQERYQQASEALHDLSTALGTPLPIETTTTRESFLRASELVGREQELARLTDALEQARQGRGSGWLLAGESGVGKSRLLAELRTQALVKSAWVAHGQARSEGGGHYYLWLPLLRAFCLRTAMSDDEAAVLKDLVADIETFLGREVPAAPPAAPQAAQARLYRTITALFRRQERPVVLLLEDLQWAGTDTLALLAHLSSLISELPLLLVGNYRDEECPDLPQRLPTMELLRIGRLNREAIARLTLCMLGSRADNTDLIDYLYRETEGNVFFLVEVIRSLAEDAGQMDRVGVAVLPERTWTGGMQRIVERRIGRVPVSGRATLELAAALGRRLDLQVMRHLVPQVDLEAWLMECANAAVLESQGGEWQFCHDKLREAILREIAPAERQNLHRKLAQAIESVHADGARAAVHSTLAYHFRQAGVLDKAVAYYLKAGQDAVRLSLLKEARGYYAAAKESIQAMSNSPEHDRQHADILLMQVQTGVTNDPAEVNLQRIAQARALLEKVLGSSAAEPRDRLRTAHVEYYRARAQCYAGQQNLATTILEWILLVADEFCDRELSVMTSFILGLSRMLQGRLGLARNEFARALPAMERQQGTGVDTLRCCMYYAMTLLGTGQPALAAAQIAQAEVWVRALDQPMQTCVYHMTRMLGAMLAADWPACLKAGEALAAASKQVDESMFTHTMLDATSWAQSSLGQHDLALLSMERSAQLKQSLGWTIGKDWWEAASAEILLNAGELEPALERAQQIAKASQEAGLRLSHAIAERVWACALARLVGDRAEVDRHFGASLQICHESELLMTGLQTQLWWGRICRERGDMHLARQHFAHAIQALEKHGYGFALQEARRIAAADDEAELSQYRQEAIA